MPFLVCIMAALGEPTSHWALIFSSGRWDCFNLLCQCQNVRLIKFRRLKLSSQLGYPLPLQLLISLTASRKKTGEAPRGVGCWPTASGFLRQRSCYVVQAGLELTAILLPPECWNFRHATLPGWANIFIDGFRIPGPLPTPTPASAWPAL